MFFSFHKHALPGLASLALLCKGLHAAPVADSVISPEIISPGEQATYQISVTGAGQIDSYPESISVTGLQISFIAKRNRVRQLSDGSTGDTFYIIYGVITQKEGAFTIPEQAIIADGTPITVPEANFIARPPDRAAPEPFVKINAGRSEMYAGEVSPLNIELFLPQGTFLTRIEPPSLEHDDLIIKRFRQQQQRGREINGEYYTVYLYANSVSGINSGTFEIGPLQMDITVRSNRGLRSPTQFQQQRARTFKPLSNTLPLMVKPLPEEGRPASFKGAVGNFSLSAEAFPTKLNVGDPISVDVVIQGTGSFDPVGPPEIETPEGWRLYPAKQIYENRSLGLKRGATSYNQIFIPEKMADRLPPFVFSYFDPAKEEYVELHSPEIPLEMSPDPSSNSDAKTTSFSAGADGAAQHGGTPPPREQMNDILGGLMPPPTAWLRTHGPVTRSPLFWAVQIVAVIGLAAIISNAVRRRNATREKEKASTTAARTPEHVFSELKKADGDRPTFYRLVTELFRLCDPRPGKRSLVELAERAEREAYGLTGSTAAGGVDKEERARVLRELETIIP